MISEPDLDGVNLLVIAAIDGEALIQLWMKRRVQNRLSLMTV